MNERIKELAIEAGYEKDMFGIGHWDMSECKKFAELLLREAIDIIEKAPTQHCAYTTYDKTVVDCTVQKIITALHSEFELKKIHKAPQ
jgi:CTP:phosphocholine cytidylyltransferase-like protein